MAQYKSEKDASIPLEHFYIERKKSGPIRYLFSKLHFGLSVGGGSSTIRHPLDGFVVVQELDSLPKIYDIDNPAIRYRNWVNDLTQAPSDLAPGAFEVSSDTADIGFSAKTLNLPIKATVHVEIDRFRLGGGYSIEYTRPGEFLPVRYGDQINSFSSPTPAFFMKKYFGLVGGTFYRYYEYTLGADLNIGGYKLGKRFNRELMQKGMYYNIGLTAEREMSEYFRVFVRPSWEFKSFRLTVPESGLEIQHQFNAWYVNIGVTYRIPELRRCPIKDCHGQINHAHGNREYRSRMHPFWKKQNPYYGENYPTLIKYKGKNKRKIHPY